MPHSKIPASIALSLALIALGACDMLSGRETPRQYVDDTAISTRIKADLASDPSIKPFQINVETMQGVVLLSGFVDSRRTEQKAVGIARAVNGVKDVKDALQVPAGYQK